MVQMFLQEIFKTKLKKYFKTQINIIKMSFLNLKQILITLKRKMSN